MPQKIDERIIQAIKRTAKERPGHWEKLLDARNNGRGGSKFESPQSIESLCAAHWQPYYHPAIQAPACGFRTEIAGFLGVVPLDHIPANTEVILIDGHDTDYLSVQTKGELNSRVDFTILLLGPDGDMEVVYTIHPGDPCPPSSLHTGKEYKSGDVVTAREAQILGFTHVKLSG